MDLTTIKAALASVITAGTGLRTDPQPRDSVSPPVAVIMDGSPLVVYGKTTDGAVDINLVVMLVLADSAPAEKAQRALSAYLGIGAGEAQSIPGCIAQDPTLGSVVAWCEPVSVSPPSRVEWAGVTCWAARLAVTVGAI